ncbi:23S rRNA (adenine(2503)-C(2))-methyltransferase RlmN [Anaeromyxobacter sp. Fw109-5]|uniref:Dual-specificity RNA methyltransferase RlmN n=1 Tax=Anaeromyxobacter sp. (strain Fw109-5) TaxID=404589 RepID=RLMN_ANADF|nr:23S rRNA (adenine(2503)-C(2))-methyltransferase RlmN [Anaeromyxobacter sp. Fw109-5]A7HCD6.1 RecName: Full=Dual-specificity RNA methyltransferase RlmN; AltName: Full=23S rRNA (adenine(2503)-C(2))-methyltransferase; AltName: Full=23S rRNA m2A2503 methyltransferase; AltName: Full=Ribosomal RNA large subunit methyltransferase N; AltName: Full=tRNA (adenine(37)-C(2))-methyltransferase; AltName: Full=tRNA m2A37 methyltransferase [Anaeromyxobacter sp. Fw109-5]ABS26382.1 radical SAM enzyme, Cfr family
MSAPHDPPRPEPRPDLRSLPLDRLERLVAALGERPFRARQLHRWLQQKGAASLDELTDVPRALRAALAEATTLTTLERATEQRSVDGTIKWTWRTHDGKLVESVYMPEPDRRTLCVSSQVGCAVGCTFCLTGTMGLARNLTPGEIVEQVHRANRRIVELGEGQGPRPLTNLVFMGMGEPLANYRSLKVALDLLLSEDGPNFSHRHVTVSTSGLVPMIRKLGEETPVKLAISLNATTDAQRDALMPINRRYPLAQLLEACRSFPIRNGRRITFEYVLLGGVNDSLEDAVRLARLVRGIPTKVNLIPYNANPGLPYRAPAPERVVEFQETLAARNLTAVVRKNRGGDISAACGQLAAEGGPGDPRRPAPPPLTRLPAAG